jgi:hypothetical protein
VRLTGLTGVEPLSGSCSGSPAGTGLTGGAHRSDRCGSVDSGFVVPLRSRVGRLCVLVPRSSGTPVATWAWPTWVGSRRRVLEAVFVLLEFSSPSRRIFIGSHSLPPSLVRRIGPSSVLGLRPTTSLTFPSGQAEASRLPKGSSWSSTPPCIPMDSPASRRSSDDLHQQPARDWHRL